MVFAKAPGAMSVNRMTVAHGGAVKGIFEDGMVVLQMKFLKMDKMQCCRWFLLNERRIGCDKRS